MTPQELKNSILQLAIQGKLVEQRPEEGTAEELYRQIQAEKQKLIKEGKSKKKKPLPEIAEDEIPFDIPDSWIWVRLGNIVTIQTGKKDANYGSEDGVYNFFTCAKEPIHCKSYSFSGEALLLAGNGDISNISYFDGQFEAYQRTYVLQPFLYQSYLMYLFYHLSSNWVRYNLGQVYGTAIPYIRLGNIENYLVALPPPAEQKRIVAKIEELLPLIDRYEKAWSRLEEFNKQFPGDMQKSILQMAIQGKLVEQRQEEGTAVELLSAATINDNVDGQRVKQKVITDITEEEIAFDIPATWTWVKLGTVCTIARGGSPRPIKDYITTDNDGINWIKIGDTEKKGKYISTTAEKIKPSGVSKSRMVHAGDFLLTNSMSFGRPYILKIDGCIHDGWLVISQSAVVFDPDYMYWMLSSAYAYSQFCEKVSGAVVKNLNSEKVANSVFPLPPLAEQKRIVARLEELLPLCDQLK